MGLSRSAIALLVLAAGPVSAQEIPPIQLSPGEAVSVRFDDGERVEQPVRSRAEWTRFDLYAARQLAGMTPPNAPMREGIPIHATDEAAPDPIPGDQVRIRLLAIGDRHALLVVENGRQRALAYRARMTVAGSTRHTDVCVVLPQQPSYEHWPHPVESIELSDFRFIPWAPGRAPTCE